MKTFLVACVLTTILAVLSSDAGAHEYWLVPSTYVASPRDTVTIAAFVGTGFRGEPKPYAMTRTKQLFLQAGKRKDLRLAALNGDLAFARFTPPDAGGTLVAFESNFVPIELPGEEFDRYLALEGLQGPLATRRKLGVIAGPGRERYARCPKTWIAGRDVKRVQRPLGLPLEIVPLADPGVTGPLRVRVLYRSRPLAGALVRAWNQPLVRGTMPADGAHRDSVGPVAEARTDGEGVARIAIGPAGEWLVSAVHMVPSADRHEADWESLWASLTFARVAKRP